MIEIIKPGKKKQTECHACGCIFTYEKEDIEVNNYGMNEIKYEVKCPECCVKCPADMLMTKDPICESCGYNVSVYNRTCYTCHDHDKWKEKK